MNRFIFATVAILSVTSVGCYRQPYTTVKTGPDQYAVSGDDHTQLKGNAYKACKEDGFDDYTVVESYRNSMTVHCEKTPKSLSVKASETWESLKNKVDEYRKSSANQEVVDHK